MADASKSAYGTETSIFGQLKYGRLKGAGEVDLTAET